MMCNAKRFVLAAATGAVLTVPGAVYAEQTTTTGAGTITANARHDFQIVIPRFLQFRVGAAGTGISLVNCDLNASAGILGDGSDQPCMGGDVGAGVSSVSVRSNAGIITLTATTTGALSNGADTIPYSEILTASSTANVPAPTLPASGGTSAGVPVAVTAGSVTNRQATWTYTYDNSAVYAAGTYGGVAVNHGRVTYTASSP